MNTKKRFSPSLAVLLVLALALSGLGLLPNHVTASPPEAALSKPSADEMPPLPQACTGTTCVLEAKAGTLTMPGYVDPVTSLPVPVPFWGFAPTVGGTPGLPGPVMTVTQGDVVVVELHNSLPDPVSVTLGSQENVEASTDGSTWVPVGLETDPLTGVMVSMVQSAPPGGVVYYRFTATNPGTFLYRSGTDAGRQVTMGLFGALVVRPLSNSAWAYDDADTAFNTEALLILSELDPDFNTNPDQSLDLFKPKFQLINGLPYPADGNILVASDQTVLLRYINAGLMEHTLGVLGVDQTIIARDGNLLPFAAGGVVESVAPGETVDTLVTMPSGLSLGRLFPVYQANNIMHNNSTHDAATGKMVEFGGMLTFLEVAAGGTPGPVGPTVDAIGVDPGKTNGTSQVTLTAAFSGTPTAAQYFVDDLTTAIPATLNGSSISVTVNAADLAAWTSDEHTFYVQAQDANGWGPISSAAFTLDKDGPQTTGLVLVPAETNGTVDVALRATGNDREFGASNVSEARYAIDMASPVNPGAMLPMAGNQPSIPSVVGFEATIDAASVLALAEGAHTVTVVSQDEIRAGENNWGPETSILLTVDKTGPATSGVSLSPSMVNFGVPLTITTVRVTATIADPLSGAAPNPVQTAVVAAEGFIDTAMANGKGFKVFPSDGLFDEPTEDIYFDIPVREFSYLNAGMHNILIHGRDVAGNWGATTAGQIEVRKPASDTTAPTIVNLTVMPLGGQNVSPAAADAGTRYILRAEVEDSASSIAQAQWYADETVLFSDAYPLLPNDGAFDSRFEMLEEVIDTSTWPNGTHKLMVRVSDEMGNWSAVKSVNITVSNPDNLTIAKGSFEGTGLDGWTGIVGNPTFAYDPGMGDGQNCMETTLGGTAEPSYVFLNLPSGETALTASFLFNPNNVLLADQPIDIFVATNEEPVFGIQLAPYTNNQAGYRVSAWVNDYGVIQTTSGFRIAANEVVKLGVKWEAGVNTSFKLLVNDSVVGEIPSLNTSSFRLHQLRLGPQTSVAENMAGSMYFDAFAAERQVVPEQVTTTLFMPIVSR